MNIKKTAQGFMLIEAILATSLFAFATTLRLQHNQIEKEIEQAERFGGDLARIPYAVDKRILLDGVQLAGGWNKTWATTVNVINDLFKKELIGNANTSCAGNWSPLDENNAIMALLPCNFMNSGAMPFNFNATAESIGGPNDSISELKVKFFHSTNANFEKAFHLYPTIVRSASLKLSPQITGSHTFRLVDIRNDNEITISQCQGINVNCAIEASYSTNNMGLGEDVYLRVNGQNMMHGNIGFAGGGGRAKCSKVDGFGGMVETNCGITTEIVGMKDEVQTVLTKTYASEFILANNYITNAGALVDVVCQDANGNSEKCGMTVIQSGATALTTMKANNALMDNAEVYGSLRTVRRGGTPVDTFSVDADTGNIYGGGALLIDGLITANSHINLASTVTEGGICSTNGLLSRDSEGAILSCEDNFWVSPAPKGGYIYFNAVNCPKGWVQADGNNGTVDLRGEFIRGWDNGRDVDSSRALGSWQDESTHLPLPIRRTVWGFSTDGSVNKTGVSIHASDDAVRDPNNGGTEPAPIHTDWRDAETKPRNVALLACMKK